MSFREFENVFWKKCLPFCLGLNVIKWIKSLVIDQLRKCSYVNEKYQMSSVTWSSSRQYGKRWFLHDTVVCSLLIANIRNGPQINSKVIKAMKLSFSKRYIENVMKIYLCNPSRWIRCMFSISINTSFCLEILLSVIKSLNIFQRITTSIYLGLLPPPVVDGNFTSWAYVLLPRVRYVW